VREWIDDSRLLETTLDVCSFTGRLVLESRVLASLLCTKGWLAIHKERKPDVLGLAG
jgi:hypothetical protein